MSKKKKIIITVSAVITVLSVFCIVVAAGAFGPDRPFHKRGMPHFMKKEISEFVLWKMDKNTKELGLDNIQQKNYTAFREKLEETINTGLETKLNFKQQAMTEFEKETPDLSAVTTDLQTHIQQLSTQVSENLALFNTFYNSLDASQKKQISDHIKEKRNSCRGRYQDGPRG